MSEESVVDEVKVPEGYIPEDEVKGLKISYEKIKAEKKDGDAKIKEMQDKLHELEEAAAKAEGNEEKLRELEAKKEREKREALEAEQAKYEQLVGKTKAEKIDNMLHSMIADLEPADKYAAQDLRDLVKTRFKLDYDFDKGDFTVSGDGVDSLESLKKVLGESGAYDRFLKGTGATGGGATGSRATGDGTLKHPGRGASKAEIAAYNKAKYGLKS